MILHPLPAHGPQVHKDLISRSHLGRGCFVISWKRGAALGPREKSCWVRRGASALQNRIMPKLRHNLVSFKIMLGTSPVAQWLRLHLPVQGLWVRSLGHAAKIPHTLGPKNKTSSRSNIVTNSINTKNGK